MQNNIRKIFLPRLRNIYLVLEQVLDLIIYFNNIKLIIWKHTINKYIVAEINLLIHFY